MKKHKLLHIFSAPQSVYYFLDKQVDYIASKGFEVHIILPDDGYFSSKIKAREKNAHLHFIPLERKISIFADLKSFFLIYIKIRTIKPDILHLHTPKASFIGALAGKLAFQKNIIYQMHGLVSSNGNEVSKGLFYFIEKTTCTIADRVFAVSPSLREFAISNKYCKKSKIKVIANGTINGIDWKNKFNLKKINYKNKYLSKTLKQSNFIIGFVGRIHFDKGIEDFLKVIKKLEQANLPVYSIIVGPNEIKPTIGERLKALGLHHFENLKVIDEIQDPENVICDFDVLLFPTKREGFGLVAAEANSLEVPVIAYDIPGVRDAIENNKTGKLVEYENIDQLHNSILEYYNKPSLKKEHGKNGRMRVKTLFDQKLVLEALLEEYKRLLKEIPS